MSPLRACLLIKILIIQIQMTTVFGQVTKGSLAFVIDNTASMRDDINQVRDGARQIFDTVLQAKDSQIQDYVLVMINDPVSSLRIKTENTTALQLAINETKITPPNGDCPENAMKGIELALINSSPYSYIFVFTDAAAKDYLEYDQRVKKIAQQKQSQIVFALTGECKGGRNSPDYKIYDKIAEDTSGQVFHIDKGQVKDLLKYVRETVTGRSNVIASLKFDETGSRQTQTFNFTVDSKTGSITIAVSGYKPEVVVTDPDGIKLENTTLVDTKETKIEKLTNPKPGTYSVLVSSDSHANVLVTGKTNIYFQHGFSPFAPMSIDDTATRPSLDGNTFLSIKLTGEGVTLQSARILNMDNSIFAELPLEVINDKEQFYATKQFNPPNTAFRIEVVGYDVNNETVVRRAQTSIERSLPDEGEKVNMAPNITLPGGSEMAVEYEAPLTIQCKVRGYPEPTITWQEMETGVSLLATVHKLEGNVYMSILEVKKSEKNCTYQCKASNTQGADSKNVAVVTKIYLDVIEIPQNQTIEYNRTGQFTCKVHALPSASITWYINSTIIGSDANIEISDDASVMTIKQMQLDLVGNYKCKASNKFTSEEFYFYVGISGVEIPKIDKPVVDVMHARRGTHAELPCKLTQGKPKPVIRWEFRDKPTNTFRELQKHTETIEFGDVTTDDTGSYKCTAENIMGSDQMTVDLIVEYPPIINQDNERNISVKNGEIVSLMCTVDSVQSASVQWHRNDTIINDTQKYRISEDNSMRFNASLNDIGYYTCVADNGVGTSNKTVFVDVYVPITIENPGTTTIDQMVGLDVALRCTAHGYPEPIIQWFFQGSDSMRVRVKDRLTNGTLVIIPRAQIEDQGAYTCSASNVRETVNLTYTVNVGAAPNIQNMYTLKSFRAVVGDLALRIQCNATGGPKPTISWIKDGSVISLGTDQYEKAEDDTLIIKNITRDAQGNYVCHAANNFGNASETYAVDVIEIPEFQANHASTQWIENGATTDMECPTSHNNTDQIRWYKDEQFKTVGELKFNPIMKKDAGQYTCRVSNDFESWSVYITIKIGSQPAFTTEEVSNINDLLTPLKCEASGDPQPSIKWQHNGTEISYMMTNTTFVLETGIQTGIYICTATNLFGSIHRTFNVTQTDCLLDTKNDFLNSKQPLMVTDRLDKWLLHDVGKQGYIIIKKNEIVHLACPKKNGKINGPDHFIASCVGDKFNVKGKIMKYSEIECTEEIWPKQKKLARAKCLGIGEQFQIRFRMAGNPYPVYQGCIGQDKVTLYTVHTLKPGLTNVSRNVSQWTSNTRLTLDSLFICGNPARKNDKISDKWRFEKKLLVNYRDLHPNIPVTASFQDSNMIPLWTPRDSNNWDEVEKRVRILATDSSSSVLVYTGAFRPLQLSDNSTLCLQNKHPVMQYLWKVVEDKSIAASLVIIQVNVPGLSSAADASPYVFCDDICSGTIWMNSTDWHDVTKGYIFCCNSQEFDDIMKEEYKLNRTGRLLFQNPYILYDANTIPKP